MAALNSKMPRVIVPVNNGHGFACARTSGCGGLSHRHLELTEGEIAMRKMIAGIMYLVFVGTLLAGCATDRSYQPDADQSGSSTFPKSAKERN